MKLSFFIQEFLILSMVLDVLHPRNSTAGLDALPLKTIRFVVTNYGGCSLAFPSTVPAVDMRAAITELCHLSFPFDIQLFGETIVSSHTPLNQTVAGIAKINSVANDLEEIWGGGFTIPLTVHPISEDIAVYAELARLCSGLDSNMHEFEWYRFIVQCVHSKSCTVQELCDSFWTKFGCQDGKLTTVKIQYRLTGIIDLNFVPSTLNALLVDHNAFSDLIGLDQLSRKQLRLLDVRGSPLDIDLEPLTQSSSRSAGNPLRYIRASPNQVSWSLIGIRQETFPGYDQFNDAVFLATRQAAIQWFPSSILDGMTLGRRHRLKRVLSNENDTESSLMTKDCDRVATWPCNL